MGIFCAFSLFVLRCRFLRRPVTSPGVRMAQLWVTLRRRLGICEHAIHCHLFIWIKSLISTFHLRVGWRLISIFWHGCSQEYHMIMGVLWKRLNDSGKNWRHVYKVDGTPIFFLSWSFNIWSLVCFSKFVVTLGGDEILQCSIFCLDITQWW